MIGRFTVIKYIALLIVLFAPIGSYSQSKSPPVVAVLENPQCQDPDTIIVRALFVDSDTGWIALTNRGLFDNASIHPGMKWTIGMGGKSIGNVQLVDVIPNVPNNWSFPRDMFIGISTISGLPLIENFEKMFCGWCNPPKYRPLVLCKNESVEDPDKWVEFEPDISICESLYPIFRSETDSVFYCPDTWEVVKRFDYKSTDLIVIDGYRNNRGQTIVALQLDIRKRNCDGPPGFDWASHWFLLGEVPVLLGRSLEYVDAGDFNGDGESEVLFWYSAYNRDGYTLFSNKLTKRVDFWWGYH